MQVILFTDVADTIGYGKYAGTFKVAMKLVHEIYNDQRVLNKSKFSAATWIGRVINLGYTVEDIFKMLNDTALDRSQLNNDLIIKGNLIKDQYYNRIMEL